MSDIQLFRLHGSGTVTELAGKAAPLEKTLQTLIEGQMETFLGVRFLASEYTTGRTHKGRIDSLGLDENGCPVIVEYKRHSNENVINQGLFYLDWLLDHQAEFRWLVMEKLGKETAEHIEWTGTRLLCIAADFTRYDQHAVHQIPRNIELIRYKLFGDDLLLLELVNAQSVPDATAVKSAPAGAPHAQQDTPKPSGKDKSLVEQLALATPEIRALYEQTTSLLLSLGDDVQQKGPQALYGLSSVEKLRLRHSVPEPPAYHTQTRPNDSRSRSRVQSRRQPGRALGHRRRGVVPFHPSRPSEGPATAGAQLRRELSATQAFAQ